MNDEKLEKALEALKVIGDYTWNRLSDAKDYAADAYGKLTEPEYKEVKGWINIYGCGLVSDIHVSEEEADRHKTERRIDCIEITYRRPIPEQEEVVWEGEITGVANHGSISVACQVIDFNFVGKKVIIRLKGE